MMKGTRREYPVVERLPAKAVTVRQYAESLGFTIPYIYKLNKKGKAKIVVFSGVNFVIPT